ncbi:flagellar basal body-associated FliL family protein [Krasilnikovia sp. MM14-A1004]|uniref:flagellar basal body-associated FliL family protein n=1 Tax=Krasilnikovia sp. MM14-A1004 TaxID=3373541 RepID=UPI00399CB4F7
MSEKDGADAPKKKSKKKLLMIIVAAVVLLGGGAAGGYFMFAPKTEKKPEPPVKGVVVSMEDPMTINLASGHYLKLGFALQLTEAAGEEKIDTAEARDLAIKQYTGMDVAVLETEKGRDKAKDDLLTKLEQAYEKEKTQIVMDIYFTQFVTQ